MSCKELDSLFRRQKQVAAVVRAIAGKNWPKLRKRCERLVNDSFAARHQVWTDAVHLVRHAVGEECLAFPVFAIEAYDGTDNCSVLRSVVGPLEVLVGKEYLYAERKNTGPQLVYLGTLVHRVCSYEAHTRRIAGDVLRTLEKPSCHIVEFADVLICTERSYKLCLLFWRLAFAT